MIMSVVNDKANAYIREKIVKVPEDMTFITPNLAGILARVLWFLAMGYPGNPKTRNVEPSVNKADVIAYYLETCYPEHYMLFNLAEEIYDAYIFHDHARIWDSDDS